MLDACDFAESVLVTSPADTCWRQVPGEHWKVVDGGASRAASVAAGLAAVEHADWVLVHENRPEGFSMSTWSSATNAGDLSEIWNSETDVCVSAGAADKTCWNNKWNPAVEKA